MLLILLRLVMDAESPVPKNLKLEIENVHSRDSRIEFYEKEHYYTIDGERGKYKSVTTKIHDLFEPFNADLTIKRMMKSKNWPNSKYFGMTAEMIKEQWSASGKEASTKGTALHRAIELYYNEAEQEEPDILNTKEYGHFLKYLESHGHKKAYRTEWSVFDEEIHIAGQIDMCYMNEDGTVDIYDWKRSKEIKKQGYRNKSAKPPIDDIPDSNFWHYSLQLNIYRYILETKYGYNVKDMAIVVLHPNNESFKKFKIPRLEETIDKLVKLWRGDD